MVESRHGESRRPGDLGQSTPTGSSPHPPTSADRQRAFAFARRPAMALCRGLAEYDDRHWCDCVTEPGAIERYRWLIVAMGVARATPADWPSPIWHAAAT